VFLGTSIHDTSQVVGASLIYSQQFGGDDVVPAAALTKLIRNCVLLLLVPAVAWFSTTSIERRRGASSMVKAVFPVFLLSFLALACLRTAGDELLGGSALASTWLKGLAAGLKVSDFLLICGMAAMALNVSLRELRTIGLRVLGAAFAVAVAVASCSLALTLIVQRLIS
jgi:uncharacterized membrane protein YadS